jgi:hypothetical protein
MSSRQPDLFLADPRQALFDQRPERKFYADPDKVRAQLHKLLEEAKAAELMPWDARTLRLHETVFPQMANWLPEEEAEQLCFAFAEELERLKAA